MHESQTQETPDCGEEVITASTTVQQEAVRIRATGTINFQNEADWFRKNIKKRVCTRFVECKEMPDFGPDITYTDLPYTCECGNAPEEHIVDVRLAMTKKGTMSSEDWNEKYDTQEAVTDAFGEVDFIDSSKKVAKYVRLDERTDTETLRQLFFEIWKLERPTLVISVIGGVKLKQTKPKVLQAFRRGILKVVRSGAWLLTGGFRHGIVRIVGDAASSTMEDAGKTVCLGIVPWGVVANREELVKRNTKIPAHYTISTQAQTRGLSLPLDPNHTHFLLVDNGTSRLYGTESVMRDKVESLLANLSVGSNKQRVPLCCVVFCGGLPTFRVMHNSLKKGTPVVVVNGSGRIADLLSYVISQYQQIDDVDDAKSDTGGTDSTSKAGKRRTFSNEVDTMMVKWLNDEAEAVNEIAENVHRIKSVVKEYYHLLHVFNRENDASAEITTETLDLAILRAILGAKSSEDDEARTINQLMLALQWNRCDVAQTEILTNDFRLRNEAADHLFTKALTQDRVQFVQLLLDQGFNLREYLTLDKLLELYNHSGSTPFKLMLSEIGKRKKKYSTPGGSRRGYSMMDIGRGISELCGGMYYSTYQHDPIKCDSSYSTLFISERDHLKYIQQQLAFDIGKSKRRPMKPVNFIANTSNTNVLGDVALHLFFYAVLMNRKEMAMVFWKIAQHKVASAQMASFLLDKLVVYANDRDVRQLVMENATYFDELAVGVLDACYSADQCHTHLLILRELRQFAGATCMDLSNNSANMPFIAHTACQTLLNDIWHGEIKSSCRLTTFLCILCPPLIPILIDFHPQKPPALITSIRPPTLQSDDFDDFAETTGTRPAPPIPLFKFSEPVQRVLEFYCAPKITFLSNVMMYVVFVMLFSVLILFNYSDNCTSDITFLEVLLIIWVLCLFAEEFRQFVNEPGKAWHKVHLYISSPWNQLDVLSISLFLFGEMAANFDVDMCHSSLPWIRVMLNTSLFLFYSRLLHCFSANEHIGPKLVMIFKMLQDIVIIMVILVIILIGFSVVVVSMTSRDLTMEGFIYGLSLVYWAMFGELPLEDFRTKSLIPSCETAENGSLFCGGTETDPVGGYYLVAFLGVFVILTNLLLFNVLIAMFNYTFNTVQDKADQFWAYQRYKLITEYFTRPPFPPPILIFYHIYLLTSYIMVYVKSYLSDNNDYIFFDTEIECKVHCVDSVERQLVTWEDLVVDEYLEAVEQKEKDSMGKQIDGLRENLDVIKGQMNNVGALLDIAESNKAQLAKVDAIGTRVSNLEAKVDEAVSEIKELVRSLKSRKI